MDSNGIKVMNCVLTGLLSYDPKTSAPVYEDAASITSTDEQHFTIKLKDDWTFSDGTPVTAASYVDAWNYAALVTNQQVNSSYFQYIQGYTAVAPNSGKPTAATMSGLKIVNPTTFTVALTQKFSTWPQTLGSFIYDPLPASFFKDPAAWAKRPVGDGPYTVASYVPGQEIDLLPYAGYRGRQKPENKGIDLKVYTSTTAAYADLLSGRLDIDDTLPLTELRNASGDLHGRVVNTPSGSLSRLGFPLYAKGWSTAQGAEVRQGISMAINRALIASKILNGTVTPASDWTAPGVNGYDPGLCGVYCSYDPVRAKKLIAAAGGLPGGSMTISYNADGGNAPWVDAVCNSINSALGNDRACVGEPTPTFAEYQNHITGREMTGAFRTSWEMDYPLAQDFLQPSFTTNGAANGSGYSNPAFDSLINQANAASSTAAANGFYQQAEQQLVLSMPAIPLWYEDSVAGYSSSVSQVQMDEFRTPEYYAIRK
ncbi:ABC transporter substrate-binding protein [Streptacidiphilus sp. EB129]|uniref:peptide ABC transporter substrate-binding protein n=1 Tax=Streptacidiphilus sp. EB129 TaxID=3156262 RepID=UPI0035188C91